VAPAELGDDGGGVVVPAGLEGGEEQAAEVLMALGRMPLRAGLSRGRGFHGVDRILGSREGPELRPSRRNGVKEPAAGACV
jgi:hypothetical protein